MEKENQSKNISCHISINKYPKIIPLDENTNSSNEEMIQYLNEIEIVLRDIYSKGIYLKNFKKLIKAEKKCLIKDDKCKFSIENLKKYINSSSFTKKINLILDIDETLVFSELEKELNKEEDINFLNENSKKEDIYFIKIEVNNIIYIYKVQIRKNLANFFKELNPYCNFYINTMASPLYINEVVNILYRDYGLKLSNIGKSSIIYTSPLNIKTLSKDITKDDNFLILDDNICAWDFAYIPSIIPVRKFHGLFHNTENEIQNIFYQYYLFTNKIYCFDETKRPFFDKSNKIPYCVEITQNEKSQLYYICEMIKKSFLLSKILDIPIRHALHFIQNTILKECFI